MFVDATPDGELMKTFETVIREVELPVRIVERSGNSMKEMVVRSNPFKRPRCTCQICNLSVALVLRVRLGLIDFKIN